MKRTLCLILAALMLLLCFASCGGNAETTSAPETTKKPEGTEELTGRDAEKDEIPGDLRYDGETVTFLYRNTDGAWLYELDCEELMNDTLNDAIHYRTIDVENRLGVDIKTIGHPVNGSDCTAWNNALSTSVLTNTGDYDGAAIYASQSSALAKDGIYLNLYDVSDEYGDGYLNLDKPWWNQTLVDELTTYGALYFLAGDLLISNAAQGNCLYFNKDLFDETYPTEGREKLYTLAREGNWTIDKLTEYVGGLWVDANSDGVINDTDTMGWSDLGGLSDGDMDSWIYALGLSITQNDSYGDPYLALLDDPNIRPAFEALQKLYFGTAGSYGTSGLTAATVDSHFKNGNVLFKRVYLNYGSQLRESTVNYGVLPLPKLNEEQEDYRTCFCNNSSFLVFCSNLAGDRAAMLSAVAEAMASESYRTVIPTYYSTVLQGQYSKDQPNAEMYDMILKSFVADFGFAYSTVSIGGVGKLFRDVKPGVDLQSQIDANRTRYGEALESLLEALEAIA